MNQGQLIRYVLWLAGDDTGSSSKAIWCHMTGINLRETSTPADDSDFGRCFRLLALFPEWRPRIAEMRVVSGPWARLAVAEWDTLSTLHAGGWDRMVCRLISGADGRGEWWGDRMPEQRVRSFGTKRRRAGLCGECGCAALVVDLDGEPVCEDCHP